MSRAAEAAHGADMSWGGGSGARGDILVNNAGGGLSRSFERTS